MRKRNIEIKLMLNEGEYERLIQKVQQSGMNRSAFLRRLIREQTIYPIAPLLQMNVQLDSYLKQLQGIATNLNQIAKFANTYHTLPELYPKQQVVYAVHCDTDHIHFHYVANTVSYLDGSMLHWSKHDLEQAKKVCNEMCAKRGLSIAQKGRHHDGAVFDSGEITVWSKDKYR